VALLGEFIVFALIVCDLLLPCGRDSGGACPLSLCCPSPLPQRFLGGAATAGDASLLFLMVRVVKCMLFGLLSGHGCTSRCGIC